MYGGMGSERLTADATVAAAIGFVCAYLSDKQTLEFGETPCGPCGVRLLFTVPGLDH